MLIKCSASVTDGEAKLKQQCSAGPRSTDVAQCDYVKKSRFFFIYVSI